MPTTSIFHPLDNEIKTCAKWLPPYEEDNGKISRNEN